MTLHKSIEALIKEMDNAISDVGAVSKLGTIPDIWCDIRAALTDAPSCEAVGKEHCWTHDRPGEECHAPSADDVREAPLTPFGEALEHLEKLVRNHKRTLKLKCAEAEKGNDWVVAYTTFADREMQMVETLIRAAQSRPVFTESTPEQEDVREDLLEEVELCLHNHDGAAVNLRYFNEDDVSALNYSYIEVTKMLGKTFNFIRAAQSRPVFTESTPEQVEKIKGLLDKTAPWETPCNCDALVKALEFIANGCLVPPDGGAPVWPDDAVNSAKEALATHRAAQSSPAGWQTIETYDGRPAIVTDGINVAPFCDGYMPWNEGKKVTFFRDNPTHWMPLPAPPSEIVGDEDR